MKGPNKHIKHKDLLLPRLMLFQLYGILKNLKNCFLPEGTKNVSRRHSHNNL